MQRLLLSGLALAALAGNAFAQPVLFDCHVAELVHCLPMIRTGGAHNEMLLPGEVGGEGLV